MNGAEDGEDREDPHLNPQKGRGLGEDLSPCGQSTLQLDGSGEMRSNGEAGDRSTSPENA